MGKQSKAQMIVDRQERLAEKYQKKYKGYMSVMENNSALSRSCSLQPHHYAQLGMMLDKTRNYMKLKEADGTLADLGRVPQVALDVVTVTFASSALAILANVQQLPDQTGLIYYEQTRATTTRGNVTAGQILQDPLSAPQVYAEGFSGAQLPVNLGQTEAGKVDYTFTAGFAKVPVRPRSVKVQIQKGNEVLFAVDSTGDGKLFGAGLLGSIDYETGDVVLNCGEDPAGAYSISAVYSTDFEGEGNISTINVDLLTKQIDATVYALQAQIGLFKQYAMSKRLGINASDRLAQKLSDEMSNEITNQAISLIVANAVGNTEWNKARPAGVSWYLHKQEFKDYLNIAEGEIFYNAGRGGMTAIVASPKAATLIKSMPGFKMATIPVGGGATLFGMYEGIPVIRAPQIDDRDSSAFPEGVCFPIYKGEQPYDGALVYGSYMPIVAISDVPVSQNILMQKSGVATWGGFSVTCPNLMTRLTIVNKAQ